MTNEHLKRRVPHTGLRTGNVAKLLRSSVLRRRKWIEIFESGPRAAGYTAAERDEREITEWIVVRIFAADRLWRRKPNEIPSRPLFAWRRRSFFERLENASVRLRTARVRCKRVPLDARTTSDPTPNTSRSRRFIIYIFAGTDVAPFVRIYIYGNTVFIFNFCKRRSYFLTIV